MDNFTYNYLNIGSAPSNRLGHVSDAVNASANTDDIESQSANNYSYDELGQLIDDQQEQIANIEWRSGDKKIKEIIRTGNNPDYEFRYNPFGQRILKIEKPKVNNELQTRDWWRYTYYTYDANGQVMATYEVSLNSGFKYAYLKDQNIYGASRLGMRKNYMALYSNVPVPYVIPAVQQNTLGTIAYEITNYLGNVNVVISDRKIWNATPNSAFKACIVSRTDYFPFGMEISSRTTNSDNYRFGYNGMESDNETKGSGNSYTTEFRQYDPRIGRWLSLDPLMAQFPWQSPYCAFDNNPVFFTDPTGLEAEDWVKKEGSNQWEWDGDVTSQEQATTKHGEGTEWAGAGHTYKAQDGSFVELLDNGKWHRISEDTYNNINRDDVPVNSNIITETYYETETRYREEIGTHQAWAWTGSATLVLLSDDVTGYGIADDILIVGAVVIGTVWRATVDNTNVVTVPYNVTVPRTREYESNEQFYYVTYTKTHPTTGEVYVGRSSGYGSPQTVVNARDVNHHMAGFGKAVVSTSLPATVKGGYASRGTDPSYHAIRGSEQLQIEYWRKLGLSANKYNGISPTNENIGKFLDAARRLLGY